MSLSFFGVIYFVNLSLRVCLFALYLLGQLRLHQVNIRVVDMTTGIHILPQVRTVGLLPAIELYLMQVDRRHRAVAVYVTDQQSHGCRGGGQGVALVIVHTTQGNGDVRAIAVDARDIDQKLVGVAGVYSGPANRSAARARAIHGCHIIGEGKGDGVFLIRTTDSAFDSGGPGERQVNTKLTFR